MPYRAQTAFFVEAFGFPLFLFWRAGGLMLVGMALFKWGILTGKRSSPVYAALIATGALVGIPLVAYGVHCNFAADWSVDYSFFLGNQYNYWGSLLISIGYVGMIMIACRVSRLARITRPLAAVGRMALTNYLLQTIICTTVFYGHGLGQFSCFSRVEQILTVVAIWAVQLIVSPIWLKHFRFGPFEWLWRSLSYWRFQPMRRKPPATL
jgi:uncharacterized protein